MDWRGKKHKHYTFVLSTELITCNQTKSKKMVTYSFLQCEQFLPGKPWAAQLHLEVWFVSLPLLMGLQTLVFLKIEF